MILASSQDSAVEGLEAGLINSFRGRRSGRHGLRTPQRHAVKNDVAECGEPDAAWRGEIDHDVGLQAGSITLPVEEGLTVQGGRNLGLVAAANDTNEQAIAFAILE